MSGRFGGRVAIVTGAGSGIGRATAVAFAVEGASVVVADVDRSGADETVALIQGAAGEAGVVPVDVSDAAQVRRMVETTLERYGRLDYAHNNAGIGGGTQPLADVSEEQWARTLAVNLTGVWLCLKYEIPAMIANGGGAIVNTSSHAGLRGVRRAGPYSVSKHGVIGLTRTAALEYAASNVRVNAVCPGLIDTPLVNPAEQAADPATVAAGRPIARMGRPEEVAAAVLWLCSDESAFTTGIAYEIDGGAAAQ